MNGPENVEFWIRSMHKIIGQQRNQQSDEKIDEHRQSFERKKLFPVAKIRIFDGGRKIDRRFAADQSQNGAGQIAAQNSVTVDERYIP